MILAVLSLLPAAPSRAVIGGEEMSMKFMMTRYVVGIRYEDESGAQKICSGAIIGPSIVLTAARCIPPKLSMITVVFGDSLREDRAVAQLAVATANVHENYKKSKDIIPNPYDLAVIRTKTPLPPAARHMQLPAEYFPISRIPSVYVAGYGAIGVGRDGKPVGQGQLHAAIAPRIKNSDEDDDFRISVDQSKGTGICLGDDGGPMLVENPNGFILMGIASTIFEAQDADKACGGVTTFVNVHKFQEWIIQRAFESTVLPR